MICAPDQILFLLIKSRTVRWARHVARMLERRGVHRVMTGKP